MRTLSNPSVQRMSASGFGEDSDVLGALIADLSRWPEPQTL